MFLHTFATALASALTSALQTRTTGHKNTFVFVKSPCIQNLFTKSHWISCNPTDLFRISTWVHFCFLVPGVNSKNIHLSLYVFYVVLCKNKRMANRAVRMNTTYMLNENTHMMSTTTNAGDYHSNNTTKCRHTSMPKSTQRIDFNKQIDLRTHLWKKNDLWNDDVWRWKE